MNASTAKDSLEATQHERGESSDRTHPDNKPAKAGLRTSVRAGLKTVFDAF